MNRDYAQLLNRLPPPLHLVLGGCILVFLFNLGSALNIERLAAPEIAQFQTMEHGHQFTGSGIESFVHEYMEDPFGKAHELSDGELQICRRIAAYVPSYHSAMSWRSQSMWIGVFTLLSILSKGMQTGTARNFRNLASGQIFVGLARIISRVYPLFQSLLSRVRQPGNEGAAKGKPSAVYDIISCPACPQKLRIPTGKGRIRITCSGCGNQFECVT